MAGTNNPSGENQYKKDHERERNQGTANQNPQGGKKPGGGKDNPGNFANDPDRARKEGEKGGKS